MSEKTLRIVLVHERPTTKSERYNEVTPLRMREVMRNTYIERDALRSIVDEGAEFPPPIIEITIRVVDPKELRDDA